MFKIFYSYGLEDAKIGVMWDSTHHHSSQQWKENSYIYTNLPQVELSKLSLYYCSILPMFYQCDNLLRVKYYKLLLLQNAMVESENLSCFCFVSSVV